jgi:DNA-binding NarL/FixJ family response regulator
MVTKEMIGRMPSPPLAWRSGPTNLLAHPALDIHRKGALVAVPTTPELQRLSNRENEVLALVAEGNGNKQIGMHLHISERTVKNHLTGIMSKLRASDRTHAVVTASRLGWLSI